MSVHSMIGRRVGAIRARLHKKHIDALILTKPANVTYLTGFSGEDSWAIITQRAVYLLTDSRYTEQAQSECVGTTIVERKELIAPAAGRLLRRLRSVEAIAIENCVPVAMYRAVKKGVGRRLGTVGDILEGQRTVKDAGEIATIKAAAAIAAKAFDRAVRHIRPGVTESELAGILDLEIRRQGAKNSFETIVAFGANGSRPHHQPSQKKLGRRDTILIDFGARHNGYCSDITRSFAFGKPTAAYRRAYEVVERAQAATIRAAKAGASLVEVDAAARAVIRESGLPVYGHGTGHGIGLEIHETPFLKEDAKGKLQAGQIITVEPGVYIPGKLGIRVEDDIFITETGCEILTIQCPHALSPV